MQLKSLVKYLESKDIQIHGKLIDLTVTDIVTDSRCATPGCIFFALTGGVIYINDAVERGASVVITKTPISGGYKNITYLTTLTPRLAINEALECFYPKDDVKNISAVTGTNGKTSVAHFVASIWNNLRVRDPRLRGDDNSFGVVNIGTIGVFINGEKDDELSKLTNLTTPDNASIHKIVSRAKVDNFVMEASSHGLVQNRLAGIDVNIAAVTNISHDHLDYHGSMEEYVKAKTLLFSDVLKEGGFAVINSEMDYADEFLKVAEANNARTITYGKKFNDIIRFVKSRQIGNSMAVVIEILGNEYQINTKLVGDFQIENLLCAIGMVIASGIEDRKVVEACQGMINPEGRLEAVGKNIFVDFAHTPDALECAIKALRGQFSGAGLSVVFGCGGDRDINKRPMMGKIAAELADKIYITDDNPRNENSEDIIEQVASGILSNTKEVFKIANRENAIKSAIDRLHNDDILLIAGKGHEEYQIVGNEKLYFSDKEVVRNYVY